MLSNAVLKLVMKNCKYKITSSTILFNYTCAYCYKYVYKTRYNVIFLCTGDLNIIARKLQRQTNLQIINIETGLAIKALSS